MTVVVDDSGDEGTAVEVAEAVADAVVDVAETVAEAVADAVSDTDGGHDPVELEHRLTNIEHRLDELAMAPRGVDYETAERIAHDVAASVAAPIAETVAETVAEEVVEDATDEGADDGEEITIVSPEVAGATDDAPRQRGRWW